jgi:hypothetical protein
MKNAAKLTLVVACFVGYAVPALAINPQPLPPRAIHFTAHALNVQLDCSSAKVMADGKSVDDADFTATEDGDGGCDLDAKFSPDVKSVHVLFLSKDGVKRSFFLRSFAHGEAKQEMLLEK